ncbi:tyrosine-type recombinase/integrase [Cryptosporangium sp. NPDC048952]|uniref:tyrosine-type recombinase/integrase n=1 Tax=Cryptosporangium sp. NPDC048952 TaxID=3363961 RepID=UPI0037238469
MGYSRKRFSGKGKPRYTAYFVDIKGKERSAGTFGSEKEADKAWQKAEVEIAAGKVGDRRRGRQTLRRYVEKEWFPNHAIEASVRQNYTYWLNRYILPELGTMRMVEILPVHVRQWVLKLESDKVPAPTIRACKVVVDAIFTTALNDQVTYLHPGRGVKTPPVATKPRKIITPEQFDAFYNAIDDHRMRLLAETDIETGLRWGELTEARVKDLDLDRPEGVLTVARVVVELVPEFHPEGKRFLVKEYPKDQEHREVRLARHLTDKLRHHIAVNKLGDNDLLFWYEVPTEARRRIPDVLPDPDTLGRTEPNEKGRTYKHGTPSGYGAGRCRCRHCKDAVAAYRAARRAAGKDAPRVPKKVDTDSDGHISRYWFRRSVWQTALKASKLRVRITPHGLRHAHASWLVAGGADLVVVKERLGHGSLTTTERYLHTFPDAQDAAIGALDKIRGRRSA